VAPNQWLNPQNGVNYQVAVQTPQILIDSFDAMMRTPVTGGGGLPPGSQTVMPNTTQVTGNPAANTLYTTAAAPNRSLSSYANPGQQPGGTQLLYNLAGLQRGVSTEIVNHYNVQPVFDIYANVDRRDLGGVRGDIEKILEQMRPHLPKGVRLDLGGQAETMQSSFIRLGVGMVFAVMLVYLLMVVNFQSWEDPFIILMALPGAFAGVLWMLFITQTTFNVPSLMGAIMSVGVATANSILLVTFANDERIVGKDVREAALSAGFTRLRPVCMTALAMLLGMLPMALSLGEGGEQNAPLGRAVIGGLTLATFSTLFLSFRLFIRICGRKFPSITANSSPRRNTKHWINQGKVNNMLDTGLEAGEKLLPPHEEQSLLEAPAEEKLRAEVEALRKEVEQLRKGEKKHSHKPQRPRGRTLWIVGIALLVVLAGAFFPGWLPHHAQEKELQKEAREEAQALPKINFVRVEVSGSTDTPVLPGTTEALTDAPILARADGYVVSRFVDFGDRVKKGEEMAVIAAPDLDQQVVQARAQLAQAQAALMQANANLQQGKANEELARVTADRYRNLVVRGAVARQDNDQQQTNFQALVSNVGALQQAEDAARQNVESSRANLQRLIELQGFEHVTAPFDGVVTLRNIDVGALITTGSTLLFRVAQIDRLRTYSDVPQPNAPGVAVGQVAQLTSGEFGTRQFAGHVTRTAGALDPTTRTLVTEVQVPNPQGTLQPGMFVNVSIQNERSNPPILVPGDALIVDASGAHTGVLRDVRQVPPDEQQNAQKKQAETVEGTIHLQQVSIGRDYGAATEVLAGLSRGDRVIVNPNDDMREGTKCRPL